MSISSQSKNTGDILPLDYKRYSQFQKYGSFQANPYLDGEKSERLLQKNKFIAGEIVNPTFDYPKIDLQKFGDIEKHLLTLKKDIVKNESIQVVKQSYVWKINEKLAEIRMLRCASSGDMEGFRRYAYFIYGSPSGDIFNYTIKGLHSLVEDKLKSSRDDIRHAAQDLHRVLPGYVDVDSAVTLPVTETIATVRAKTKEDLLSLFDMDIMKTKSISEPYNTDEVSKIFTEALGLMDADGWSVVVDTSSKTSFSVVHEFKEIRIPDLSVVSKEKLKKLIVHEIGTHVKRRIDGERSRLSLLGLGLDRYDRGEEGIATMREQTLSDTMEDFAGLESHLAVSLAAGIDGKPRDFREVYTILQKYYFLKKLVGGQDSKQALGSSETLAWNRCSRTFKGTNCSTKGVCYPKDMVYREGNIGVWNVVSKNDKELIRFSIGRYDPLNNRHLWVLDQLGISDEDLDILES